MMPAWLPDTVTTDLDRALHYTLLWGLEGVELRTLGRSGDRVPNVNEEKLRRRLREADVPAVSIVPGCFESAVDERPLWMNDLSLLPDVLAFARRIGCARVVVSAFQADDGAEGGTDDALDRAADVLRKAAEATGRVGLSLVVVNEPGSLAPTGSALLRLLDRIGGASARAGWDPCAGLRGGEAPEDAPDALLERLALVRVRDARRTADGWEDVPPGDGVLDWPALVRRLAAAGYDGPLSLDLPPDRDRSAGPVGLRAGTQLVTWIRAATRGERRYG